MKRRIRKIFRRFKRILRVMVAKKRCHKLKIEYKKGCYIGKRIRTLGYSPKIYLGENSQILDDCVLWGNGDIIIGNNTSIGEYGWIHSMKGFKVQIGNYVNFAAFPYIINCDHETSVKELIRKQGLVGQDIIIGNDIWVGANCTILKGTELADGCVIGAGTVVKGKYLEKNSIICGQKARILKHRE